MLQIIEQRKKEDANLFKSQWNKIASKLRYLFLRQIGKSINFLGVPLP